MNIREKIIHLEGLLTRLPGTTSAWAIFSIVLYATALAQPAIVRGEEVFSGFSALLWGPVTLIGLAPFIFFVWLLNFSIFATLGNLFGGKQLKVGLFIRIGLILGLLLLAGKLTMVRDAGTGVRIPLEAKTGAYIWYLSVVCIYVLRLKYSKTDFKKISGH